MENKPSLTRCKVGLELMLPRSGILHGCPYAPTIAKLTTHDALKWVNAQLGVTLADLWLDDISIDVVHPVIAVASALKVYTELNRLVSDEK